MYTPSWCRIDIKTRGKSFGVPTPRPPHLDEMIRCAEILGDGLDFLRVDLYDAGKVYFGEMTVYPSAGGEFYDPKRNRHFGSLWNLSLRDQTEANPGTITPERQREFGGAGGL
jgi:hypothetical protein